MSSKVTLRLFAVVKGKLQWVPLMAFVLAVALCCSAQTPLPLSQSKIEGLVRVGAPDNTVASEIRRRGVDFTPSKALIQKLKQLGAGPATLQALEELTPMLDEAKRTIPELVKVMYKALNEGNPSAARYMMSPQFASDTSKLDFICKPFTYRAHYIETIIERPNRLFEARVRFLSQTEEERAYVVWFEVAQGRFFLANVRDPTDDWFGAQHQAAADLGRKFVYALRSGKRDVVAGLVSPSLNLSPLFTPARAALWQRIEDVSSASTKLHFYKGLRTLAKLQTDTTVACSFSWEFLVEQPDQEYRIVAWQVKRGFWSCKGFETPENIGEEDPHLRAYMLKRFGISVPAASSSGAGTGAVSPADREQETMPQEQPKASEVEGGVGAPSTPPHQTQTLRFRVRHRHMGADARGNVSFVPSYCEGELRAHPKAMSSTSATRRTRREVAVSGAGFLQSNKSAFVTMAACELC